MAGRAFVHVLRGGEPGPSSVASVGRNAQDEIEIVGHRNSDEAIDHCQSRGYTSALIWTTWPNGDGNLRAFNIHVLEKHGETLEAVACIECSASTEPVIAAKVADIDVPDELLAPFLAGFAEGSIADTTDPAVVGVPLRFTPREDARRLGLAVGETLAGELARLVDGAPMPCNEIGILFAPGDEVATIMRSEDALGDQWHRCATRQGATIQRGAGGALVVSAAKHWGSSVLFVYGLDVAVKRGQLQTSSVGRVVDGHDSPDHVLFLEGLHQGIARHLRGPEVLAGFGALGEYRRRDDLWNEESRVDRLLQPFRRLWRGITNARPFQRSYAGRPEKVRKLGIERDPAKVYRIFAGDVCAMPNKGNDNVILISEDRADYELVCATGITPEPGYIYYLDADGDLSRRRL